MAQMGDFRVGYFSKEEVAALGFVELISGVVWLVRNRTVFVSESVKIETPGFEFVNFKAPRTAIGHDAQGDLLLFEVDGKCNGLSAAARQRAHSRRPVFCR